MSKGPSLHHSYDAALRSLEDAHLRNQPRAWPHLLVHLKMLTLALKYRVWSEALGQVPRIILAVPGSLLGKAPKGNIGSTKMGIFEERDELG